MDETNRPPDRPHEPTQPEDPEFRQVRFKQDAPSQKPQPAAPAVAPNPALAPKKRRGFWRLVLFVALIGLGGLAWQRHLQTAKAPDSNTAASQSGAPSKRGDRSGPQPVGLATIEPRDIRIIVNALGTVTPLASVIVVSQISGQLQEVGFTEGQNVK